MKFPLITEQFLLRAYPKRKKWAHKGDFGKVLVIGGSARYRGAPALAGLSALRTGSDLVWVACPETISDVVSSFSPVMIVEPMEGDYIDLENVGKLLNLASQADSVVIGPGLGRMRKTREAVLGFLQKVEKPCVLDADALHFISDHKRLLRKGFVITPHSHEFYNLTGTEPARDVKSRVDAVSRFSKEFKPTTLLKGYKDVVSDGGKTGVNATGNPFMTVGGTGDVIAGICGSLLGMGLDPFSAACCAAYISGKAGDLAAAKLGPGMLPTDVIEQVPNALASAWK